ncbi:helix-turn-helix domain-containing protein [Enterococcus dispar]|uniref:helix-turn-helix domain-containing protein n=1 Tax=Enterococcus dispar TaxID=44009 RepID=UPI00288CC85A|nr:helix-turn-helix transcriptional regulator [Enterococcus dispar]MDT2704778.1 helix-turn-helix transcriptional regulator [Enterococcus dispar]
MKKQTTSLTFRLSGNLRVLMNKNRPIKNIELAEKSGVSANTISRIKSAWDGNFQVELNTVEKLAKGLGVDPIELLKEA